MNENLTEAELKALDNVTAIQALRMAKMTLSQNQLNYVNFRLFDENGDVISLNLGEIIDAAIENTRSK